MWVCSVRVTVCHGHTVGGVARERNVVRALPTHRWTPNGVGIPTRRRGLDLHDAFSRRSLRGATVWHRQTLANNGNIKKYSADDPM